MGRVSNPELSTVRYSLAVHTELPASDSKSHSYLPFPLSMSSRLRFSRFTDRELAQSRRTSRSSSRSGRGTPAIPTARPGSGGDANADDDAEETVPDLRLPPTSPASALDPLLEVREARGEWRSRNTKSMWPLYLRRLRSACSDCIV